MSTLKELGSEAVAQYRVYGKDSNTRYHISRLGIKGNPFSEDKESFGKWGVVSTPGMGGSQILVNPAKARHPEIQGNTWMNIRTPHHTSEETEGEFLFDSASEAFDALARAVDEELVA